MYCVGCEQFSPLVCTKCDEEQGVMSENPPQARRQFWIFTHAQRCSRFPVGSAMAVFPRVPRRPQGNGYRCGKTRHPQLPRKWHVTTMFRAYTCSVRCL